MCMVMYMAVCTKRVDFTLTHYTEAIRARTTKDGEKICAEYLEMYNLGE